MTTKWALRGLREAMLPSGMQRVLTLVGQIAQAQGVRCAIVGGVVRDLALGIASPDLDIVVEGNAGAMANALGPLLRATVIVHDGFGTASVHLPWRDWHGGELDGRHQGYDLDGVRLDLASTRQETYRQPGALPEVVLGVDLQTDLSRRDFAMNAIAMSLGGSSGEVIDPYGGLDDLAAGRLRVLHLASFSDDPTRLLRGARLAGRLLARFDVGTEALVRAAVREQRLALISGDRRRHELALLLAEPRPSLALAVARTHGLLEQVHPSLTYDAWLADRINGVPVWPSVTAVWPVRLGLMAYRLASAEIVDLVKHLRLDRATAAVLMAVPEWRERQDAVPRAGASGLARLLAGLPLATLAVARQADGTPAVRAALDWYVTEVRLRRPRLDGHALRQLGVPPGPRYRPLLDELARAARDGELLDEAAEWQYLSLLVENERSDPSPTPSPE